MPSCQPSLPFTPLESAFGLGLMKAGGVRGAKNAPYTHILDKWQLMAGTCLSQGHAQGQPSEG